MKPTTYRHLMKPLQWREGPAGLYPWPLFWMEGKPDLEGIDGGFAYGFIKEPCTCHPVEGAVRHPYDEVLVFASIDTEDILHLGGTLSIRLGEEGEEHTFDKPTVICIPAGMPHGPVTVHQVERPFAHYCITLAGTYQEERLPPLPCTQGTKYAHLVKPFLFGYDQATGTLKRVAEDSSGMGYGFMSDSRGVMHPADRGMGPGNADNLLWMYGEDLEGFEVNFTWGHYSRCGKWHRDGEMHTHPSEEALCFVGIDPDDPMDFGAELEVGMGEDCQRYLVDRPMIAVCPKDFPHLPVIIRWCDRPYGFVACTYSSSHESPWLEV